MIFATVLILLVAVTDISRTNVVLWVGHRVVTKTAMDQTLSKEVVVLVTTLCPMADTILNANVVFVVIFMSIRIRRKKISIVCCRIWKKII